MAYPTLDNLPDLTANEMAVAGPLSLSSHPDPVTGWDSAAEISGVDLNPQLHEVYRFDGKEGATYDFISASFLDPTQLRIYDAAGNAIAANEEADDPAGITRPDGTYPVDSIADFVAPYTGVYYIRASWNQDPAHPYYSLGVYEDIDTAVPIGKIRLMASAGFVGEVSGFGTIFGTNEFQHITLGSGQLTFDPSFNRGGDIIELTGEANDYTIARSGSSAVLTGNSSVYTIPVGTAGTSILFADGARTLGFDVEDEMMKIGSQLFDASAITIVIGPDGDPLPQGADPSATARVFMEANAQVTLGGQFQAFGTANEEHVAYAGGDLVLDPSFNRGGDLLAMPDQAPAYSAKLTGASVILAGADGEVSIPIGDVGMTVAFDGDERLLIYDTTTKQVTLGDQVIGSSFVVLG